VPVVSTAASNVSVIDDNFYMPQLNRYRRIWIYLPPNYAGTTQSYPVLYMHDGQNLFDVSTSFTGEWKVDESLNQLFGNSDEGIIVIGIDNGGAERINEYTPWPNPKYGGGDGEAYVDFIVQTLKPYIDANYRTKTEPEFTGIMGSSLGGLISLYGAIAHQDVFGRVGVFSPTLWFTDDIYEFVSNTGKQQDIRIFLYVGELEGTADINMVEDLQRMYNTLQVAGFEVEELIISTHADGEHREWYWAREFLPAYKWLFDNIPFIEYSPKMENVLLWPLPVIEDLHIENLPDTDGLWNIRVVNSSGRTILSTVSEGSTLSVKYLAAGNYFIVITDNQNNILVASFEKTSEI
jgi:predicted alpha/beta superfamily hydrolase